MSSALCSLPSDRRVPAPPLNVTTRPPAERETGKEKERERETLLVGDHPGSAGSLPPSSPLPSLGAASYSPLQFTKVPTYCPAILSAWGIGSRGLAPGFWVQGSAVLVQGSGSRFWVCWFPPTLPSPSQRGGCFQFPVSLYGGSHLKQTQAVLILGSPF